MDVAAPSTSLYLLYGPDGLTRYAGKTLKPLHKRLNRHLAEARRGVKTYKCNWIRSVDYQVKIDLVKVVEGDGAQEEIELIALLRSQGAKLVNGTDGGDGALGRKHSFETKSKMSSLHRGKELSIETKEKMSSAKSGRRLSPNHVSALKQAKLMRTFFKKSLPEIEMLFQGESL